jgi:hypothetical protein
LEHFLLWTQKWRLSSWNFIKKIKKIGYDVKLDTNGTNPEMLAGLIRDKLIDYIAMDLKAPLEKYEGTIGVKTNCNNLKNRDNQQLSILLMKVQRLSRNGVESSDSKSGAPTG